MLSGFNTNYRYRGVLFHVQTEDSGVQNPHVITHLFHGGNILASQKLDYRESLQAGNDLEAVVRGLMESQHKAMLDGLRSGARDAVILERLGPGAFGAAASAVGSDSPYGHDTTEPSEPPTLATLPDEMPAPSAVAPATAVTPDSPQTRSHRPFGENTVSEKPLDEVVLEYLVENARKRKRRAK